VAFQVGYLVELSSLQFDEGSDDTMTSTFMAMPYGEYTHPVYGKINFTPEVATQAAEHVMKKSRGQDLDIDYDHKQYSGEAAGWVKGAEVRSNGLYLTVSWTKKAWQSIKDKAYRYFSPEFADEWKHPKTGEVHKNILFGGGITNRPFLKDILPLNMSELSLVEEQEEKGKGMDPKLLRKLLGLPEDTTDAQVNEALSKLPADAVIAAPQGPPEDKDKKDKDDKPDDKKVDNEPQTIAASEFVPAELIKLSEGKPEMQALLGVVQKMGESLSKTSAALHLSETHNLVTKLSEPKDGQALAAGTQKLLSDALLVPTQENIMKLVQGYQTVQLGETDAHKGNHGGGDGSDGVKKFNEAVDKLMKDDKDLKYADAVDKVALSDPELFQAYRASSYSFKEN
jgi:phage I-like protein